MKFLLLLLFICFSSCSLFNGFKKRTFDYGANDESFDVMIPKGWKKSELKSDSADNKVQYYHYKNGSALYLVRIADSLTSFQPINFSNHIPLIHPKGGLIYKGIDSNGLYWREIRLHDFRFGYKNVPTETEARFDSALNFAAQKVPTNL
jgi:hypothetical protein